MTVGILQFPGSNCDADALHAMTDALSVNARFVWHKDASLGDCEALIVPGGFSYGDYLRCGAIARFSPIMEAVRAFGEAGRPILGICNGFQILCESGLLPGALIRNDGLDFCCKTQALSVEDAGAAFNSAEMGADCLHIPIAHGEGNYRIDEAGLKALKANQQILLRYKGDNPNGSIDAIAGIRNEAGNVWGMMPHPERAVDAIHPNLDGIRILKAFLKMVPQPA